MGLGTFRARAATAAALITVAGCGGGAEATPTPTPIFGTSIPSPTGNPTGNPSGQEWAGTMNESLVVGPCTSSVHATMGIVVSADGAVAGTWTGAETKPGCGSHAPFSLGSFPISGKLADRKFLFPSLPSMPYYPPPVSIPLVSSTSAVAHLVWSAPGGSQTSDFSLTCMGC